MKYRFLFSLLTIVFFFSCDNNSNEIIPETKPTVFTPTKWTKGNGTIEDPYQIEIPEHLVYLSKIINEVNPKTPETEIFLHKNFKIMNDIDLNNILFIPIGKNRELRFMANLDGNFKKILNLKIKNNDEHDPTGLFGCISEKAYVKNLSIVNGSIEGVNFVGGFAGEANAIIENCSFEGTITAKNYVGGIAGYGFATITNCSFNGSIQAEGHVGGIIGDCYGTTGRIEKCFNKGTIKGISTVGGIVGYKSDCVVQECYNIGTITASSQIAGGIIGWGTGGNDLTVRNYTRNCYNKGEILTQKYAAGIIGRQYKGEVYNSYNTGKISNILEEYNNPIANGHYYVFNEIDNCYYSISTILLGPKIGPIRGISKEHNYLLTTSFVNDLNNNILPNAWKQDKIPNINGGLPILHWQ